MSSDVTLIEIRDLLGEIRDLLRPVADAHQDEYDQRQAERQAARIERIRSVISTQQRKKAWALADGTRAQGAIAKEAKMTASGVSMLFKDLRELGALSDDKSPKRLIEVDA
jgi:hypothetical protein